MRRLTHYILSVAFCLCAGSAYAQVSSMEIPLDFTTGGFVDANYLGLAPGWATTTSPKVTITSPYGNYISGTANGYRTSGNDHIALFAGVPNTPYQLTIEEGYTITGYKIEAFTEGEEFQIAYSEGNNYFDFGENEVDETVELGSSQGFQFWLAGNNSWLFMRMTLFVESEKVAPVRYVIKDKEGATLLDQMMVESVGTVVSELPSKLKRDFTTYEYGNPVTVVRNADNVFEAVATFNLPFTANDEKRYFVNLGGMDFLLYAMNTDIFSAKEECTLADSLSLEFQWMVEGDPYRGIALRNAATDRYAVGSVAPGSQYTAQYSDLVDVFSGWDIVNAEDVAKGGFKLYMNGTDYLCIYNYNFYVANQEYYYTGKYGLITLSPVPDYEPVEVTYVVVDNEGNEVARESEYMLAGDQVSGLPDHMKRGFCTYKTDAPFKASKDGENVMRAVVTYKLPFQTLEENGGAWYVLSVGDTILMGVLDMDDGSLQAYGFGVKDGFSLDDYRNEKYCWWGFSGNPYKGFTLKNADTFQYFGAAASGYAYVRDEEEYWYVGEGTNKGITLTSVANDNHIYYVEGPDQFYNFTYSYFITTFKLEKVPADKVGVSVPYAAEKVNGQACYDLQGRKVARPQAGLYIMDGRKLLK
ncbi:MAG: hypothetical protein SPL50_07100 [Alloprevotella sp.]|nr:hypothetical protein [Alloprevotella sp.]